MRSVDVWMRVVEGIGVVAKTARPVVGVSRISKSGGVGEGAGAFKGFCIVSCVENELNTTVRISIEL